MTGCLFFGPSLQRLNTRNTWPCALPCGGIPQMVLLRGKSVPETYSPKLSNFQTHVNLHPAGKSPEEIKTLLASPALHHRCCTPSLWGLIRRLCGRRVSTVEPHSDRVSIYLCGPGEAYVDAPVSYATNNPANGCDCPTPAQVWPSLNSELASQCPPPSVAQGP